MNKTKGPSRDHAPSSSGGRPQEAPSPGLPDHLKAAYARTEAEWDAIQDAIATVIGLQVGHTLTEADRAALDLVDRYQREDEENATEAYHRGYQDGLLDGGSADIQKLINERDDARTKASTERALAKFYRGDFVRGASACRTMMANFVEQGGDPVTANSIRLNWNPEWGDDPGRTNGTQASPADDATGAQADG